MQRIDCLAAMADLQLYLDSPAQLALPPEAEAALRHITECRDCQTRLAFFGRALAVSEEDRLTCQECEEWLPAYIESRSSANTASWRPVALHLATCWRCAATYIELADLLELAQVKQSSAPLSFPTPKLPFRSIVQAVPAQTVWRLNNLGRLIVEFSAELLRSWQPLLAPAGVKSSQSTNLLYQITVSDADPNLIVTITAEQMAALPTHCLISVNVDIPSRGGWPNLAGSEVVLRYAEQILATQQTDAFGKVVFEDLEIDQLPGLLFEIMPNYDQQSE